MFSAIKNVKMNFSNIGQVTWYVNLFMQLKCVKILMKNKFNVLFILVSWCCHSSIPNLLTRFSHPSIIG